MDTQVFENASPWLKMVVITDALPTGHILVGTNLIEMLGELLEEILQHGGQPLPKNKIESLITQYGLVHLVVGPRTMDADNLIKE